MTHILLASEHMRGLAERIVEYDDRIQLGRIDWGRFPDSFPNTFIHNVSEIQRSHVSFLASFETPGEIFEQISVMYSLAKLLPVTLKILLPYFPTGTMERVDQEGQIATAGTLAHMLSAIAPSGPGTVRIVIYDIHALAIRDFFHLNVAPLFKSATKYLRRQLDGKDVSIAFPDAGAYKRFRVRFMDNDKPTHPFIVCDKVRSGEKRVVTIREGEVKGRNVVIFDDLIHSGGTTIECKNALMEAGAVSVSAYATHGVMENGSWKRFVDAGFERVWITDSCPKTADAVRGIDPFEIISLNGSLSRVILR